MLDKNIRKADRLTFTLNRSMPNAGGPKTGARKICHGVSRTNVDKGSGTRR